MALPDLLPIPPFTAPARGAVELPGSKSLTNRALLLAALSPGPVRLTGALFSDDTRLMAEALRALGFHIEANASDHTVDVSGQSAAFPATAAPVDLFVGLAGTAARFLTAFCAAAPRGTFRLDGVPQMRQRPMKGLIDALRGLGAHIRCTGGEGFFPLEIVAGGLRGGRVTIDARESSQMLSALLMVAPLAAGPVEIHLAGTVRWPFVEMTIRQMAQFGSPPVLRDGDTLTVGVGRYHAPGTYHIEPDATAASYFATLPLVAGGSLTLQHLGAPGHGLQGDTRFLSVLESVGARLNPTPAGIEISRAPDTTLHAVDRDFANFSDTFLTLAALAPLLHGPTRITGIAHTRKQETDRVAGIARELRRLGQQVAETEDSLLIEPRPLIPGVEIETYHDHRFAMSFGILGCHDFHGNGAPWLAIRDPGCCAKTFPRFFELLESLRQKSSLS